MHTDLAGKRVMVVEDEFILAMLIEEVLTDAGWVVVGPFARVADALSAARTESIDIALLDVDVAREKVFPVAYVLEERGIPFLFVTGYGDSVLPQDRPDWQACTKPYRPEELATRLAAMVDVPKL